MLVTLGYLVVLEVKDKRLLIVIQFMFPSF